LIATASAVGFACLGQFGTYLRSLAHDLGKKLGPGGHLAALKRTAVREFVIEEAHSLMELEQIRVTSDNRYYVNSPDDLFLHPRLILPEFPAVTASPEAAARISHGSAVNLPEFSRHPLCAFRWTETVACYRQKGRRNLFQPKVVLQG